MNKAKSQEVSGCAENKAEELNTRDIQLKLTAVAYVGCYRMTSPTV